VCSTGFASLLSQQISVMTQLETQVPLERWLPVTWDEFVKLADDPASAKLKGFAIAHLLIHSSPHCRNLSNVR
jgi:hypothetical protein